MNISNISTLFTCYYYYCQHRKSSSSSLLSSSKMATSTTTSTRRLRLSLLTVVTVVTIFATCIDTIISAPPPSASPLTTNTDICDLRSLMHCNCDASEMATIVRCFITSNNLTANDPVWDLFQFQPKITRLTLSNFNKQNIAFFPTRMLPHLRQSLVQLEITNLPIRTLETGAIRDMPLLEEVLFVLCENMTVQRDAFHLLPSLKKVSFSNSDLSTLVDMFEHVPQLVELYLEENNIRTIETGAFGALSALHYIALDRNMIAEIHRPTFTGLSSVTRLEMNRNQLRYLPPYTFTEMPKLQYIELTQNQISIIDANAFSGLAQLQEVKLDYNQLHTLPSGVFAGNPELVVLDLAHNSLKEFSWQVFYQPEKQSYIRVHIKANPIHCSCSLYWMGEALLVSYDSIVQKELETIDCHYYSSSKDDQSVKFASSESRPRTIYSFLTNKEVMQQCKLPAVLLAAKEKAEKEKAKAQQLPSPDEDEDKEKEDENKEDQDQDQEVETKSLLSPTNEKNSEQQLSPSSTVVPVSINNLHNISKIRTGIELVPPNENLDNQNSETNNAINNNQNNQRGSSFSDSNSKNPNSGTSAIASSPSSVSFFLYTFGLVLFSLYRSSSITASSSIWH